MSLGMRIRMTRNTAAPTQCTSLNGTTQFYNKVTPNKLTFTDDFVVSAWVKLSAYNASSNQMITSRLNGTSGWRFYVGGAGQIILEGFNGGSGNFSNVVTYQSIPVNKWVHVAAQLDMSTFTASTTTSYIMIDGVDVPVSVGRGGTNPTALVQAGNLEIGSYNSGTNPFNGKIAQVAIYNAKVTQAIIQASMSQTLAGTETSLASAYSFNNSLLDLNTTTPNNLTANGSAVATNADSPYAQGATAGQLEYGIVTGISFSTNTTVTVQVAEGSALPTSGTISAASYSTHRTPYGFPAQRGKWQVLAYSVAQDFISIGSIAAWFSSHMQLTVPIGSWVISYALNVQLHSTVSGNRDGHYTLHSPTYNPAVNASYIKPLTSKVPFTSSSDGIGVINNSYAFDMPTSDIFTVVASIASATGSEAFYVNTETTSSIITAENAYL